MGHLTTDPLRPEVLVAGVQGPDRGAVALFIGNVRDHHAGRAVVELEYSVYLAMAEKVCETIVAEARDRWPVEVALAHRIGLLPIGAAAVIVAVGAAHREAAFAACRYVIEEVKRRAPIWKRERYADGSEAWVDPTAAGGIHPVGPRMPNEAAAP